MNLYSKCFLLVLLIPFFWYSRMVNGLLKTAQGVPPGVTTTLQPPHDGLMKAEAMKCLVAILNSMGDWMNRQLRIPDSPAKRFDVSDSTSDPGSPPTVNGSAEEHTEGTDTQSEASGDVSDVTTLEQRRAYKLELQVPFWALGLIYLINVVDCAKDIF